MFGKILERGGENTMAALPIQAMRLADEVFMVYGLGKEATFWKSSYGALSLVKPSLVGGRWDVPRQIFQLHNWCYLL